MRYFLFLLMGFLAFSACRNDGWNGGAVSDRDIKVARYDRLQYEATVLNSFSAQQRMSLEFPNVTKLLIEDVLELGSVNEPAINERLYAYYSDTTLLRLMDDVSDKFKDVSDIEQGLTKGFARLEKEVPGLVVPRIYTQISALNQSVVVTDSLLGISLDKYMGEDYPLYRRYYYPHQYRSMKPDRILPDCFVFYLMGRYPFEWHPARRTLFDQLMYRGKIYWVVGQLIDAASAEDLMGYTEEEKAWCKAHLQKVCAWIAAGGYLGSTDPMVLRAFTRSEPGLMFEGKPLPPSVGIWLGIQWVEKYRKQHPDLSVADLLEKNDFSDFSILTTLN